MESLNQSRNLECDNEVFGITRTGRADAVSHIPNFLRCSAENVRPTAFFVGSKLCFSLLQICI